mmetsp:Transcript_18400/g.69604  ORF Transcript_18400/g.69604 Transcript_18400/m.69604 type:complete len:219 (-) Transcript_18400:73-729(-)
MEDPRLGGIDDLQAFSCLDEAIVGAVEPILFSQPSDGLDRAPSRLAPLQRDSAEGHGIKESLASAVDWLGRKKAAAGRLSDGQVMLVDDAVAAIDVAVRVRNLRNVSNGLEVLFALFPRRRHQVRVRVVDLVGLAKVFAEIPRIRRSSVVDRPHGAFSVVPCRHFRQAEVAIEAIVRVSGHGSAVERRCSPNDDARAPFALIQTATNSDGEAAQQHES